MLRLLALFGCAALVAGFGPVISEAASRSSFCPIAGCYELQKKQCKAEIEDPYECRMLSGNCGKFVGTGKYTDEGFCYFKAGYDYSCDYDRKSCVEAGNSAKCESYLARVRPTEVVNGTQRTEDQRTC